MGVIGCSECVYFVDKVWKTFGWKMVVWLHSPPSLEKFTSQISGNALMLSATLQQRQTVCVLRGFIFRLLLAQVIYFVCVAHCAVLPIRECGENTIDCHDNDCHIFRCSPDFVVLLRLFMLLCHACKGKGLWACGLCGFLAGCCIDDRMRIAPCILFNGLVDCRACVRPSRMRRASRPGKLQAIWRAV